MISGRVQLLSGSTGQSCHISNGEQIVAMNHDGYYELDWVPGRHRVVFTILSDRMRAVGRWWYPAEAVVGEAGPEFKVRGRRPATTRDVRVLHTTDFHVLEPAARDELHDSTAHPRPTGRIDFPTAARVRRELRRLLRLAGPVDFVIATGDLTNAGDETSLRAVAGVLNGLPIPVYPIFGGHDGNFERHALAGATRDCVQLWTRHLAPAYYSWNWGGRHFVSFMSETASYLDPVGREMHDAFAEADLRIFGNEMPVTIASHKHPYPWNESLFHRYRVDSWLHGHFHCSRVMDVGRIRVFSTGTLAFGSMDSIPSPARIVEVPQEGSASGRIVSDARARRHRTRSAAVPLWSNSQFSYSSVAAPLVADGHVFCGISDRTTGTNGGVACLDMRTGQTRWQRTIHGSVEAPVLHNQDCVVTVTQAGLIACMHAGDGRTRWEYTLPEAYDRWIYSPPIHVDGRVVVGTTSCLVCLDLASGTQCWMFRAPRKTSDAFGQLQGALTRDGNLFIAGYRTGSFVLDVTSGTIRQQNDDSDLRYASRVCLRDDFYVVGDGAGGLSCFNVTTGSRIWRQTISENSITSAFVPFAGGLLGGTAEGLILCDAADGRVLTRRRFGRDVVRCVAYRDATSSCPSSPCVVGKVAWIASADGYLNVVSGRRLKVVERALIRSPMLGGLTAVSCDAVVGVSVDGVLQKYVLANAASHDATAAMVASLQQSPAPLETSNRASD